MTPAGYRETLAALGLTQQGAADFLGVSLRTSHGWAAGDARIPVAVAKLLTAMVTGKLPRIS
jgi:DNA-binding transcriptional regulator YiaG